MVQAVELKFNCFFLMPVVDSFPTRLREELEAAYEEDIDEVGHAGIHCVVGLWCSHWLSAVPSAVAGRLVAWTLSMVPAGLAPHCGGW